MSKYAVLDLETTVNATGHRFGGSPHEPSNRVLLAGVLSGTGTTHMATSLDSPYIRDMLSDAEMIVGHNLAFDLLYLRRDMGDHYYKWISTRTIWDTQIAEYLLTGQRTKFASLDNLSQKYGGTVKNDIVKNHWANGGKTEDIDPKVLMNYLKEDLENTDRIFKAQIKKISDLYPEMLPVIQSAMEFRLATIEMEFQGLYFDQQIATRLLSEATEQRDILQSKIVDTISNKLTMLERDKVNPNSNDQIAIAIYGGEYKYLLDTPIYIDGEPVLYKSGNKKGQIKTKKQEFSDTVLPWCPGIHQLQLPTDTGKIKVDDRTLRDVTLSTKMLIKLGAIERETVALCNFIAQVLSYRSLTKEIGTYLAPYSQEHTWPHDSCIHPNFNHASTATGRLSSSKPNVQNITRGSTGE